QLINVKSIYKHPSYSPATKLDNVVLIQLKDNFKFNDYVKPICLPEDDDDVLTPNLKGWVVGWGYQKNGGSVQNSPMQAKFNIDLNDVCQITWSRNIYNSELCAGEGDKTVCNYDEGDPLMIQSPNG
ncbi:hypothetical protein PFISCL1PPCAC_18198, partial [Pristionchus fissidentatus]